MPRTNPIEVRIIGKDELSSKLSKFSSKLNNIGRSMTTHLTLPIGLAGYAVGKLSYNFAEGMASISTLIPGNRKRVEELKDVILNTAKESGKGLEELQAGMRKTISDFQDNEETVGRFGAAVDLAMAGRSETIDAIRTLSAVTKAYGDTSADALKKVSDLALLTDRLGSADFPELAGAIQQVAASSAALNVSQEEMFSVFSTLTGVTGDAGEVATQLNSIYTSVFRQTGDMAKTVKSLGYESASAMIKEIGLRESLLKLNVKLGGLDNTKKIIKKMGYDSVESMIKTLGYETAMEELSKATEVSGDKFAQLTHRKEALLAILALLGGQTDKYKSDQEAMTEATKDLGKTTADVKAEITDGVGKEAHELNKLKASYEIMAVTIGDRLLPVVVKITDAMKPFIDAITNASDEQIQGGLKLAAIAFAAGPVLRTVGALTDTFIGIRGAMKGAEAATMAMNGTLGKLGKTALWVAGPLAAAAAGYGLGSLINETIVEPHSNKQAKKFSDVQFRREEIKGKILKTGTKEEKLAALKTLQEDAKNAGDTTVSAENIAGTIASVFTDVESPQARLQKELTENIKLQKELLKSLNKKENTEVKVTFDNVPEGTKIEKKKKRKSKNGSIMEN